MRSPEFSIIIPLFNHEKYIGEAIKSVLSQSLSEIEIIVVNDGSTDNSELVINEICDKRIRYFYQDNQGAHVSINRGIEISRGEFVGILNSDDVYHPERLETALRIFEDSPSVSAVFSEVELIDAEGTSIQVVKGIEDYLAMVDSQSEYRSEGNIILDLLAGNYLITTSNLICRKEIFDKIGKFRSLRYAHDYDFFLRLCHAYSVYHLGEPLLRYRVHSKNTLKQSDAEVDLESGLVIADYLLKHSLNSVLTDSDLLVNMSRLFKSLHKYNLERIVMILVIGATQFEIKDKLFDMMKQNTDNPFKKVCLEHLNKNIDDWRKYLNSGYDLRSQEADFLEAQRQLIETKRQLDSIKTSSYYRVGRLLSRPLRKLFPRRIWQ